MLSAGAGRDSLCLVANHGLVALGTLGIEDFNPEAAEAARWTMAPRRGVALLPDVASAERGAGARPALPRERARPIWEYVLTDEAATATSS